MSTTQDAHDFAVLCEDCAPDVALDYDTYLDKVYGGWLGKSIGGTVGARFEGQKRWLDVDRAALFPDTVPPNDDLDLQVLWLKVLEEKGEALTSEDLAAAWLEWCWYPFCEYGIFRRNWRLGIHPPYSGAFTNQFWETGMGCPIRSEIWGYICPGRPHRAAQFAQMDGSLDHTESSVGAERMFSAMAAQAFYENDLRRLLDQNLRYLPAGSPLARNVRLVIDSYDAGMGLFEARQRLTLMGGHPEACDTLMNVPIIVLALLYGQGDLETTLLAALRCGYDTDCTMATACAFVGQILGARGIPDRFKEAIGDRLVMGIEYRRPDMTLSALARDTVRVGVSIHAGTPWSILGAPTLAPLPVVDRGPTVRVDYEAIPSVGPGESITIRARCERAGVGLGGAVTVEGPEGWRITPCGPRLPEEGEGEEGVFTLTAPERPVLWPLRNLFTARHRHSQAERAFGVTGAGLWYLLGVHFHLDAPEDVPHRAQRAWHHHFADLHHRYMPEPDLDVCSAYEECSRWLGRPAVLCSYEHEIELSRLIHLRGACCAYLARVIVSKARRQVHVVIGNTDPFRLYLNHQLVGERNEHVWWTPQNNSYLVTLEEGRNLFLLKMVRHREEGFKFTLGVRAHEGPHRDQGQHFLDWDVEIVDGPLVAPAPKVTET